MSDQNQEAYQNSKLYRLRHSTAHILAQAVMEMFPGEAQIAIGPPIENGFYYDFDLPRPLTLEDLPVLEKRMCKIIAGQHKFIRSEPNLKQAHKQFEHQKYKLELIETFFSDINIFTDQNDKKSIGSTIIDFSSEPFEVLRQGDGVYENIF